MTFRNTSQYDTNLCRKLIRYATRDVDMHGVHVNLKNATRNWRGMAYNGVPTISNAPRSADYLITIGIGGASEFPAIRSLVRRGEPKVRFADWQEALVFIAAHEAKHIEQFREGKKLSEVACNNFAFWVLRRYRVAERKVTERIAAAADRS